MRGEERSRGDETRRGEQDRRRGERTGDDGREEERGEESSYNLDPPSLNLRMFFSYLFQLCSS